MLRNLCIVQSVNQVRTTIYEFGRMCICMSTNLAIIGRRNDHINLLKSHMRGKSEWVLRTGKLRQFGEMKPQLSSTGIWDPPTGNNT